MNKLIAVGGPPKQLEVPTLHSQGVLNSSVQLYADI